MKKFLMYEEDITDAVRSLAVRRKRINGDLDRYEDEPTSIVFLCDGVGEVSARITFKLKRSTRRSRRTPGRRKR